jgi:hypothetical protein
MRNVETNILNTLRALDFQARSMATVNPKPDLRPLFARLDELTAQLPADADPELRHFLQRKSYEKALRLLEGRGASNAPGQCGH